MQGNCDAEGRLILSDALFEAASSPGGADLVIDAATLTVR
jgi:leucyl aminopeptidase